MQQRLVCGGLACLDKRFDAVYPGDRLEELFGRQCSSLLIRRGILRDIGISTTIPHCVCDLRRPQCTVRVDCGPSGSYRGYCNEYGSPIEVSLEQIKRYEFSWKRWAEWLRRANRLAGAGPSLGSGCLYVGEGTVAGRCFGLLVVAPGSHRDADTIPPPEAYESHRPLVFLLLGNGCTAPFGNIVLKASESLGKDLVTIRDADLERVLADLPVVVQKHDLTFLCYSNECPRGKPIDRGEYERLHREDRRSRFDLLVDIPKCRIWRKGRACQTVLNKKGVSTGRRLGERSVRLLADYIKHPGVPMIPYQAPSYRQDPVEPRSAAVMLAKVRRSIRGGGFLRTVSTAARAGESMYVFEPPQGMTYCLIERTSPPQ